MSNKIGDENVANIEEDVNELKRLLYSDNLTQYGKRKLVNYYEQRIQELETKLLDTIHGANIIKAETPEYVKENYIPKQIVIELKESITLDNTIVGGRRNGKTLEYGIKLGKIKACEELLEDMENGRR